MAADTAIPTFAVKLHIQQIWEADVRGSGSSSELLAFGRAFQRVWIQGEVVQKTDNVLMISEGGCSIAVKRSAAVVEMWEEVQPNTIVMVIGKFLQKKDSRMISAHKVRVLEDATQRQMMWLKELQELHTLVYPSLPPLHQPAAETTPTEVA